MNIDKKFYICEETGSVYWKEGKEIGYAPLCQDGTFNTEDGGIVETWDEVAPEVKEKILTALNHE